MNTVRVLARSVPPLIPDGPRAAALVRAFIALLLALLAASSLRAQEPLQFNVPYRCADGTTYTITKCEQRGRFEFCFWREEKNGQLVVEAYSERAQMYGRLAPCPVQKPQAAAPASGMRRTGPLNPPYLIEMPTVERVMSGMKTDDPKETALRQIGAFWQLGEIIKELSGPREFQRTGLTPDEIRILTEYSMAEYNTSKAADAAFPGRYQDSPTLSGYTPYRYMRGDRRFGIEGIALFQTFFSPQFHELYNQAVAADQQRHQQFVQNQQQQFEAAKAQAAAAQAGQQPSADQMAVRRCINSGRSEFDCLGEAMKKGAGDLLGVMSPGLKKMMTTEPGLRMSGIYTAPGIALVFPHDQEFGSMGCGQLVMQAHPYKVVNGGSRVTIQVTNGNQPLTFALQPNGSLVGPPAADVAGQIIAGYTRQWVETRRVSDNTVVPGSGHYEQVPIYKDKVEHCTIGTLALKGGAPSLSPTQVITSMTFLGQIEKLVTGSKDFKVTPGLRLIGEYAGPSGFGVEFRRDNATLSCGEAVVAHSYAIQFTGTQLVARIGDGGEPIVLTLQPDGRVAGSGQVHIAGRSVVGTAKNPNDSSDEKLVFAPTSATCNVGTLALTQPGPSEAEQGAAAARASLGGPIGPTNIGATPVNAGSRGDAGGAASGGAMLSVDGGPATGGKMIGSISLLRESFDAALARTGMQGGPGTARIQAWGAACNHGGPECQQGAVAARQSSAAGAPWSPAGYAQFSSVPVGTYYVFGVAQQGTQHLVWNVRVDLKPGKNSVRLDSSNAVVIP
jgi:hypothetical protein